MITVNLLGSGNVGTHLFKAFSNASNVSVNQWYSRNLKSIQSFQNEVSLCDDLSSLDETDILVLAVSDDAVATVSEQLPTTNGLVVHTSGSVNIHDLDKRHRRGVFYPVQTFSKEVTVDFSQVPLCIEALEKDDYQLLKSVASAIGSPSYKISTEQRQYLHVAAVFVNNFSNQMYRIAHEISDGHHINFDILKPLITETAKKVQTVSPYMAQTGPAKRHDKKTIKRHLKLLEDDLHKEIYTLLTDSIKKTHGKKL